MATKDVFSEFDMDKAGESALDVKFEVTLMKRTNEMKKAWARMSKGSRAVRIARDAIWQATHLCVVPISGNAYVDSELSTSKNSKCYVCGIGGLFVGLMDHKNLPRANGGFGRRGCVRGLAMAFDPSQLDMIESAFEVECDTGDAGDYGRQFYNDRVRFLHICANIIYNKGKFVPKREPTHARYEQIITQNTFTGKDRVLISTVLVGPDKSKD